MTSNRPIVLIEGIADIEAFERYTAVCYFPFQVDNRFQSSRNHIVHKLGFDASSTICLAHNERIARRVAVKAAVSSLAFLSRGRDTEDCVRRQDMR